MGGFFAEWLGAVGFVLASSGPYLLLGFVIAGLLKTLVPDAWIVRRIGGDDVRSVTIASLLGLPLPMCSCSVIPTATQLRRSGASKGATTSFLVSAPEIGVESVGVTWALMDPLMTLLRPIAAFFTAFVSGTLVNGLVRRGGAAPGEATSAGAPAAACCDHGHGHDHGDGDDHDGHRGGHAHERGDDHVHGHGHGHDHTPGAAAPPRGNVVRRALAYAFGPLLDDLAPWLVLGFALAGLIVVLVPDGFFGADALLSGWPAMFAMLLAGIPLYVCASASTPVAAALMAKGLDPGAALVLLLAGPATNVATILVVRDLLGREVLLAYLAAIAACSLAFGALANSLYPFLGLDPTAMRVGDAALSHGWIALAAGALVALLVLRSAAKQRVDLRFARALARWTRPLGFDPTRPAVRGAVALAALFGYALSGLSVVPPGETGFLVRYGAIVDTLEGPAHRWHLPWPFTRLETVPVGAERQRSYGFRAADAAPDDLGALDLVQARVEHERLAAEAEVLTRDEFLIAVGYTVRYRVADARTWRYGHEDPDALLGALAEAALRSAASRLAWRDVLHQASGALGREVEQRLAGRVRALGLGCEVVAVDVRAAAAPGRVQPVFRDVASAIQDATSHLNRTLEALTRERATSIETALSTVRRAEAEAIRSTAGAAGEAASITALGEVWRARPAATRYVLWLDQLERSLADKMLYVVLDAALRITTVGEPGATSPTPPPDIFAPPPASGQDHRE